MRHLKQKSQIYSAMALMLTAGLTGCGKQQFAVSTSASPLQSPGSYIVPPKVDILLAEDDSGSISEAYAQIKDQLPQFLTTLEGSAWDYRFATIPLTRTRTIDQVLTSKHDSHWGSQWTPAFPGAPFVSTLPDAIFKTPGIYTGFIRPEDINYGSQGWEPGLGMIRTGLQSAIFRKDALQVVLVVGNGEDTSGVTYCVRGDGLSVPCEDTGGSTLPGTNCWRDGGQVACAQTRDSSFNTLKTQMLATKNNNPALLKFYAAVSSSNRSGCLGGYAYRGARYQKMANDLGGQSYDVCSEPISSVLGAMGTHLHGQRLSFRTQYLFIDQDANPDTIEITRYMGGNPAQGVRIPRDTINGWSYAGWKQDVYAIDAPVMMNLTTGWAIKLNGTAKLIGDDTANVVFKPAGAANSN